MMKTVRINEGKTSYLYYESKVVTSYSSVKWFSVKGRGLKNYSGNIIIMIGSTTDISQRKNYEEKIKSIALYDMLTNLPNRYSYMLNAKKYFRKNNFVPQKAVVIFIDLDDFIK